MSAIISSKSTPFRKFNYQTPLDFNNEQDRLKSFKNNQHSFKSYEDLATTGLYLTENGDVKCHFCSLRIKYFPEDVDCVSDHFKNSPCCPLLRQRTTENQALDEHSLKNLINGLKSKIDVCGTMEFLNYEVKYPQFASESCRKCSFDGWSVDFIEINDLAEAGFFYTGNEDKVVCFSCGCGLKGWEDGDVPLEEHKKTSEDCEYLNYIQGCH